DANNIVLWAEISYEAADAVRQLLAAGDCYAEPASPLVYMLDGFSLNLPLAQRAVAYKTPHWLPVTLNPGPAPKSKTKKPSAPRRHHGARDGDFVTERVRGARDDAAPLLHHQP